VEIVRPQVWGSSEVAWNAGTVYLIRTFVIWLIPVNMLLGFFEAPRPIRNNRRIGFGGVHIDLGQSD
jgi:hypothetical protein